MSLPARTLAVRYKTKVFPTPVSPTRKIVYGAFALFFDVMILFKRLYVARNDGRNDFVDDVIVACLMVVVLFLSSELETCPEIELMGAGEGLSSLEKP